MTDDWHERQVRMTRAVAAIMADIEAADLDEVFGSDEVEIALTGWSFEKEYGGLDERVTAELSFVPRKGD